MKVQLRSNDALRVLSDATLQSEKTLERNILKALRNEGLSIDEFENINISVSEFMEELGYTKDETFEILFLKQKNKDEILSLLSGIIFFGTAEQNQCEECGCEMEVEFNEEGTYKWKDYKCENAYCEATKTNEPDWDSMKGGFDNEK